MNYKKFKILITTLEKTREKSHALYLLGVNLMDYDDMYHTIITNLLTSVFDKEGKDWIDWYLYERIGFKDKVHLAQDKDGNYVFLAESDWILRMNQTNNPEIEFHFTSEFKLA